MEKRSWKVIEITKDNKKLAYPNEWNPGKLVAQLKIKNLLVFNLCGFWKQTLCIRHKQSIIWCRFRRTSPFVFNLNDNNLEKTYTLQRQLLS
jgi:hypothetical protein